jgi:transcriptional regulator with XRE-family HTH domain
MTFQELGVFIRQARKEQGIRQQQMADDLGMARATLSGLETGRVADIGLRKVMLMLSYLNYELEPKTQSALPTFESLRSKPSHE